MTTKTIDSKGRLALGSNFAGRLVIVDDADPDKIVITVARAIPEKEAWLYKNKEALGKVRRGLAQARERRFCKTPPDLAAAAALFAELQD